MKMWESIALRRIAQGNFPTNFSPFAPVFGGEGSGMRPHPRPLSHKNGRGEEIFSGIFAND